MDFQVMVVMPNCQLATAAYNHMDAGRLLHLP